ncbi:MAG: glycerol kinase, partial [Eubacteriaceae bacterium]|nr:glycerol kinase [Eubacteriaceae bacterium]
MMRYIMALDEGTTSARSIIYDENLNTVAVSQKEFTQKFPKPSWVEHDAEEIFSSQLYTMKRCLEKASLNAKDIAVIGITNQRETTVVWDRNTGKPVYNAIVWQCRRTADYCEKLTGDEAFASHVKESTGLLIDPYFCATKIKWILDNVSGAREKAEAGELL